MERGRRTRLTQRYGVAVLCLAALCMGLYTGIGRAEADTARLRAGNDAAEMFAKEPQETKRTYGSGYHGGLEAAAEAVQREIAVSESSEEMPSAMVHGDVHTLRLSGTGNFKDLFRVFDAVHAQGDWLAIGVRRIERTGETLRFELEVSEYRERNAEAEGKNRY